MYATPDLGATVADLDRLLGVSLSPGGRHVGFGTRNFLAALGGAYLEVIGVDSDQPAPGLDRPFGVDQLTEPRLVTWAARVTDLGAVADAARAAGYDPGPTLSMSRQRSDGVLLEWQVALPGPENEGGLVPFLIDWGNSPHPSEDSARGVELVSFTGTHPEPARVKAKLAALGQELTVTEGPVPFLRAELVGPAGRLVLT